MEILYTLLFAVCALPLVIVVVTIVEKPALLMLEKAMIAMALTFMGGGLALTWIGTRFERASKRVERRLFKMELKNLG